MYEVFLITFLVIVAIPLVTLIMLQQGKGADVGASLGAGVSDTLFGSSGSANFITRITAILATLFFVISLALANINSSRSSKESKWENLSEPIKTEPAQLIESTKPENDIRP